MNLLGTLGVAHLCTNECTYLISILCIEIPDQHRLQKDGIMAPRLVKTIISCIKLILHYCRWAKLLCITPPKRYYHLHFLTYLPGLQKQGRNHFPKKSHKINSLVGVQGDCPYIFVFSFSKLF